MRVPRKYLSLLFWLKGLPGIYDAFSITCALDFQNLEPFLHEVWIHGGIFVDSYRILAMFHGTEKLEDVALSLMG